MRDRHRGEEARAREREREKNRKISILNWIVSCQLRLCSFFSPACCAAADNCWRVVCRYDDCEQCAYILRLSNTAHRRQRYFISRIEKNWKCQHSANWNWELTQHSQGDGNVVSWWRFDFQLQLDRLLQKLEASFDWIRYSSTQLSKVRKTFFPFKSHRLEISFTCALHMTCCTTLDRVLKVQNTLNELCVQWMWGDLLWLDSTGVCGNTMMSWRGGILNVSFTSARQLSFLQHSVKMKNRISHSFFIHLSLGIRWIMSWC